MCKYDLFRYGRLSFCRICPTLAKCSTFSRNILHHSKLLVCQSSRQLVATWMMLKQSRWCEPYAITPAPTKKLDAECNQFLSNDSSPSQDEMCVVYFSSEVTDLRRTFQSWKYIKTMKQSITLILKLGKWWLARNNKQKYKKSIVQLLCCRTIEAIHRPRNIHQKNHSFGKHVRLTH